MVDPVPPTEVRTEGRGSQLVVVKRATGTTAVERLAHEATLLRRASVPGVITFVSYEEVGEPDAERAAELVTVAAGDETLASMPPADERSAVEVIAGVAAAVADLHSIGIAHRALRPEHVVIGADRRAVLCGFGDAAAVLDPALFLADTEDLGALIDAISAPLNPRARLTIALAALADQAQAGELTPRALAQEAALLAASPRQTARRNLGALAGKGKALVAVLACGIVAAALTAGHSDSTNPAASPAATTTTAPAPTIERDGVHYTIGLPGDHAVAGAWRCGPERVALLRPATGEVFVFDGWATPAEPATANALTKISGARDLIASTSDGSCARLFVRTASAQIEIRTEG